MHLFKEGGCSDYILKGGINLRKSIEFMWLYIQITSDWKPHTISFWLKLGTFFVCQLVVYAYYLSVIKNTSFNDCLSSYDQGPYCLQGLQRILVFLILLVVKRIRLRSFANCLIIKRQFIRHNDTFINKSAQFNKSALWTAFW